MSARTKLLTLAARKALNKALQRVDLAVGSELSKPDCIIFDLTYRCRCRCRHCGIWRVGARGRGEELPGAAWRGIIDSFGRWLGRFTMTFSGGDPLLHPEALAILRHGCEREHLVHVNSTGLTIDEALADELMAIGLQRVNISLDGMDPALVADFRGREGALAQTLRALDLLQAARERRGASTLLAVTLALCAPTLPGVLAVLDEVRRRGLDGFQLSLLYEDPTIDHADDWHARSPLWIHDLPRLREVIAELERRQREGWPVTNAPGQLAAIASYFAAPGQLAGTRCHTPVRAFGVGPNGDANICYYFSRPLGNLLSASPEQIWRSAAARDKRDRLRHCDRICHLINATYERPLSARIDELRHLWQSTSGRG